MVQINTGGATEQLLSQLHVMFCQTRGVSYHIILTQMLLELKSLSCLLPCHQPPWQRQGLLAV